MVAKQLKETLIWTSVSVLLALLLVGVNTIGLDYWLRFPIEGLVRPWLIGSRQLVQVVKTPIRMIEYWQFGSQRIADLEERLAGVVVANEQIATLESENELMRQQLSLHQQGFETIAAARKLISEKGLWIDKGERHGLVSGMMVLDEQGVLVGKLGEVGQFTSSIVTPSDSAVSITVAVRKSGLHGVLRGQGTGAALTEVLQADPLESGDVLITSGEDGVYPPGLIVAIVEELVGDESAVTKGARVRLLGATDGALVIVK